MDKTQVFLSVSRDSYQVTPSLNSKAQWRRGALGGAGQWCGLGGKELRESDLLFSLFLYIIIILEGYFLTYGMGVGR